VAQQVKIKVASAAVECVQGTGPDYFKHIWCWRLSATSASSLMADSPWPITSWQSVAPVTISCGSCIQSLEEEAVKAVVHAFISSRLDYCNSLLTGVNEGLLRRLQCVQNAAARLVTGTRRCEHITPALRQLHWLPVRQRIQYKLASLAFHVLSGLVPDYLAGDC